MSEHRRDKDGNVIWPKPGNHIVGKILHSCKDSYKNAGMWRETPHEKEFWGRVTPQLANRDDSANRITYGCSDPIPNKECERAGWCVECKEPLDVCLCDDEIEDLAEVFGD